jgi:hypothetical protein
VAITMKHLIRLLFLSMLSSLAFGSPADVFLPKEDCGICLETLSNEALIHVCECAGAYCVDCLEQLAHQATLLRCPHCRKNWTRADLIAVCAALRQEQKKKDCCCGCSCSVS